MSRHKKLNRNASEASRIARDVMAARMQDPQAAHLARLNGKDTMSEGHKFALFVVGSALGVALAAVLVSAVMALVF